MSGDGYKGNAVAIGFRLLEKGTVSLTADRFVFIGCPADALRVNAMSNRAHRKGEAYGQAQAEETKRRA